MKSVQRRSVNGPLDVLCLQVNPPYKLPRSCNWWRKCTHWCSDACLHVYSCTYPLYVHILCLYTLIYTYIHTSMYLYCIDFVWSPRIEALLGAHCGRDRGGLGGRAYREWAPLAGPTLRPLRDPLTVLLWTALCGVGTYMPVQYRVVNAGVMVGLMCTLKGFWASQDGMSC